LIDGFDAFRGDLQLECVRYLNDGIDDELAAGRQADRFRAALTARIAPPVLTNRNFDRERIQDLTGRISQRLSGVEDIIVVVRFQSCCECRWANWVL